MKSETLFLKTIINELDFLGKQLLFNEALEKKRFIVAWKQINRKIPDPCNAKESQSFLRRKNRKSVKQSKMVVY